MSTLLGRLFFIVGFSIHIYIYAILFLACRVSAGKSGDNFIMPCVAFPLLLMIFLFIFNFCHLYYYGSHNVPPWINPVWNSLHFLNSDNCFLSYIREVFSYYFLNHFLWPFLLSLSPPTASHIM